MMGKKWKFFFGGGANMTNVVSLINIHPWLQADWISKAFPLDLGRMLPAKWIREMNTTILDLTYKYKEHFPFL